MFNTGHRPDPTNPLLARRRRHAGRRLALVVISVVAGGAIFQSVAIGASQNASASAIEATRIEASTSVARPTPSAAPARAVRVIPIWKAPAY
jgi:hypothetical protein